MNKTIFNVTWTHTIQYWICSLRLHRKQSFRKNFANSLFKFVKTFNCWNQRALRRTLAWTIQFCFYLSRLTILRLARCPQLAARKVLDTFGIRCTRCPRKCSESSIIPPHLMHYLYLKIWDNLPFIYSILRFNFSNKYNKSK